MGIANLIGLMDDLIDELAYPSPRENRTGIPDTLKRNVEARSGYSLDDVRVHYHSDKPARLDAAAYAQGRDIYVATGAEAHLAHEVWHTVQQKMGRVRETTRVNGEAVNDDPALEREAEEGIYNKNSNGVEKKIKGYASYNLIQLCPEEEGEEEEEDTDETWRPDDNAGKVFNEGKPKYSLETDARTWDGEKKTVLLQTGPSNIHKGWAKQPFVSSKSSDYNNTPLKGDYDSLVAALTKSDAEKEEEIADICLKLSKNKMVDNDKINNLDDLTKRAISMIVTITQFAEEFRNRGAAKLARAGFLLISDSVKTFREIFNRTNGLFLAALKGGTKKLRQGSKNPSIIDSDLTGNMSEYDYSSDSTGEEYDTGSDNSNEEEKNDDFPLCNIEGKVEEVVKVSIQHMLTLHKFPNEKKIHAVSGDQWLCYIRCVLTGLNCMSQLEVIQTQIADAIGDLNLKGVTIGEKEEETVHNIIRTVTGKEYYVRAWDSQYYPKHEDCSKDKTGQEIQLILTNLHFSLIIDEDATAVAQTSSDNENSMFESSINDIDNALIAYARNLSENDNDDRADFASFHSSFFLNNNYEEGYKISESVKATFIRNNDEDNLQYWRNVLEILDSRDSITEIKYISALIECISMLIHLGDNNNDIIIKIIENIIIPEQLKRNQALIPDSIRLLIQFMHKEWKYDFVLKFADNLILLLNTNYLEENQALIPDSIRLLIQFMHKEWKYDFVLKFADNLILLLTQILGENKDFIPPSINLLIKLMRKDEANDFAEQLAVNLIPLLDNGYLKANEDLIPLSITLLTEFMCNENLIQNSVTPMLMEELMPFFTSDFLDKNQDLILLSITLLTVMCKQELYKEFVESLQQILILNGLIFNGSYLVKRNFLKLLSIINLEEIEEIMNNYGGEVIKIVRDIGYEDTQNSILFLNNLANYYVRSESPDIKSLIEEDSELYDMIQDVDDMENFSDYIANIRNTFFPDSENPALFQSPMQYHDPALPLLPAPRQPTIPRNPAADRVFPSETVTPLNYSAGQDGRAPENVTIHTGPYADELTRSMKAFAVTIGKHIYLMSGVYSPGTETSEAVMQHELTHVKQFEEQRFKYNVDTEALEREAVAAEGRGSQAIVEVRVRGQMFRVWRDELPLVKRLCVRRVREWLAAEKEQRPREEGRRLFVSASRL